MQLKTGVTHKQLNAQIEEITGASGYLLPTIKPIPTLPQLCNSVELIAGGSNPPWEPD
jgi:hypothetical protein